MSPDRKRTTERRADRLLAQFQRLEFKNNNKGLDRAVRRIQKLTGAARRQEQS